MENKFVAVTPDGHRVVVTTLGSMSPNLYKFDPKVSVALDGTGIDPSTGKKIGTDHGLWFIVADLPAVLRRIDAALSVTPPTHLIQGL